MKTIRGPRFLTFWSCYLHCLAEAEAYDCEVPGPSICPATKGRNNLRFNLDWGSSGGERDARATWAARFLNVGEHGLAGGHLGASSSTAVAGSEGLPPDYSILSVLGARSTGRQARSGFGASCRRAPSSGRVVAEPGTLPRRKNRVCASVDTPRCGPLSCHRPAEPPADDAALMALGLAYLVRLAHARRVLQLELCRPILAASVGVAHRQGHSPHIAGAPVQLLRH